MNQSTDSGNGQADQSGGAKEQQLRAARTAAATRLESSRTPPFASQNYPSVQHADLSKLEHGLTRLDGDRGAVRGPDLFSRR